MKLKIKTLMVGAGALALTACGEGTVGKFWYQEAGAFIDEGGFGNATMQNTLAQLCVGKAKGYLDVLFERRWLNPAIMSQYTIDGPKLATEAEAMIAAYSK